MATVGFFILKILLAVFLFLLALGTLMRILGALTPLVVAIFQMVVITVSFTLLLCVGALYVLYLVPLILGLDRSRRLRRGLDTLALLFFGFASSPTLKEQPKEQNFSQQSSSGASYSSATPPPPPSTIAKRDPYTVLGIPKGASRSEVKAAFKEKLKQNHPDLVASLDPAFQRLADVRIREINEAYEVLVSS